MDTYQYELAKKLSFIRFGGTDAELTAANILLDEIEHLGGQGTPEEFSIPAYSFDTYSVKVVSPYEKKLATLPMGLSGSFPEGGIDLKLFYAEDGSDMVFNGKDDLSGAVVMVNELGPEQYKRLSERNAAAILVIKGKWYDETIPEDFLYRHLRPHFLKYGKIPTLFITAKDAAELVLKEAELLHIELRQRETENISRNVVATIIGKELPHESIVISAHYDSVNVGTGSWDNASGSATAMYIFRYFLKNPPKRTLRFLWCGSEEQGLLGSRAYIETHSELWKHEIKFGFNFDMCGTALGVVKVCVTGGTELKNYAEAFCREYGINASVYADVRSSDSAVFADYGIPTMDIIRRSSSSDAHNRYDLMDTLSPKQLKKEGDFAIAFIDRVANSAILPVGLGMPEDMQKKLDKYFARDNDTNDTSKGN